MSATKPRVEVIKPPPLPVEAAVEDTQAAVLEDLRAQVRANGIEINPKWGEKKLRHILATVDD